MGYYKKFSEIDSTLDSIAKSGRSNKKLLTFAICLAISSCLWLIISLNKSYTSTITFTIKSSTNTKQEVVARIYGNGYDILKEKMLTKPLVISNYKKKSVKADKFILEEFQLDDNLKYSDFEPAIITFE